MPQLITLGKIGKTYGIKGWFKVISFTNPAENILNYPTWTLKHPRSTEVVAIEASRPHAGGFIAKIKGCETPEEARLYTNAEIQIPKEELPELAPDEHYWHDLIGIEVYDLNNKKLGVIDEVMATGANDVLRLKGESECLIPYIPQVIQTIDLENKRLIVDWDPNF